MGGFYKRVDNQDGDDDDGDDIENEYDKGVA